MSRFCNKRFELVSHEGTLNHSVLTLFLRLLIDLVLEVGLVVVLVDIVSLQLLDLLDRLHVIELILERQYDLVSEVDVLLPLHVVVAVEVLDLFPGEHHASDKGVGLDALGDEGPLVAEL